MASLTAAEIAHICQATVQGDAEIKIVGASTLESAGPQDLSFLTKERSRKASVKSRAGCLIVPQDFDAPNEWTVIRVADPRGAFARVLSFLYPKLRPSAFIHPTAMIASSACISKRCYVGAYVVIEEEASIADGCYLGSGVHVGERVSIGKDTTIHAHVTLYEGTQIGCSVTLHAGCVIGADGFGFALSDDHYEKFPQIGVVSIEDDVEIGANSCVDRATLGVTRIGAGSKLDNLVHVAHNCTIGKHVVIAAQTGLAGAVVVEDYAILGGQVGVADKARIKARAVVGAKSGIVSSQIVDAGEPVWGIPARPIKQHLRGLANVGKIAGLREDVRLLKKQMELRVTPAERKT